MFRVLHYGRIGSTSDEALRLAREGAVHGTVVIAREQTAGRGRAGRQWISPPGNLYMSVLLRPDVPAARIPELSFVAALGVADIFAGRARLKWPNDVLVDGAKIAGILVEQAAGAAIVGIGINIAHCPEGTPYPVTCLQDHMRGGGCYSTVMAGRVPAIHASGQPTEGGDARDKRGHDEEGKLLDHCRDTLLTALATRLETWTTDGFAPIRLAWLDRAHPPGTQLRAGGIEGAFVGVDDKGALLLDTESGPRRIVGGEVQLR